MWLISGAGVGRIATQGDDVADTGFPIGAGDGVDFGTAGTDTGQVGGGGDAGFAGDGSDCLVGAFAGTTARTIGHGNELRAERGQAANRQP